MTVGVALILGRGPQKGGPGSVPGAMTSADVCLDGGNGQLSLLRGKQRGLKTIDTLKGRQTCGSCGKRVVGVLHPWKLRCPGSRVGGSQTTQGGLQFLVGSLRLAVSLRMEPRGQANGGPRWLGRMTSRRLR